MMKRLNLPDREAAENAISPPAACSAAQAVGERGGCSGDALAALFPSDFEALGGNFIMLSFSLLRWDCPEWQRLQ